MKRHSWLNRLRERPNVRLNLELLEDRSVPSAPIPAGSEFRVNSTTTGLQETTIFPHNYSIVDNLDAVATDAAGNYVVVWSGNGPGDADGVFAQRYDSTGNALGGETRLNTTTAGAQTCPIVARASTSGKYATAWDSANGVYGRFYNASGTAVTGEIAIAAASNNTKNFVASIAMDAAGNSVVVYKQIVQKGFYESNYWYAQRYNASGQAQGKAIKVASPTLSNGQAAGVGMDAAGNFVVAWAQDGHFIYAQRYDSSGRTLGSRITVNPNSPAGDTNWQPGVGMGAAGDFVITRDNAWPAPEQQYAQSFSATGTPRGAAFTFGAPTEIPTSIAVEGNGDFILAWATAYPSPSNGVADIRAQRFDANGVAKESAIAVNTTTAGDQVNPSVAVDAAGGFVVVWNNPVGIGNPPDDCDVYGQRYTIPASPLLATSSPATPVSQTLTVSAVKPLVNQAIAHWQLAGADVSSLRNLDIRVADLGGTMLGLASGHTITLDSNAAGWGWFVDLTPRSDSEFTTAGNQGEQGHIDLLSVLMHEVGHLLGHGHDASGLMSETLATGVREIPETQLSFLPPTTSEHPLPLWWGIDLQAHRCR